MVNIPDAWYNILADLDFALPPDVQPDLPAGDRAGGIDPQVPLSLVRQEMSREPWVPIPAEVRERYAQWRDTPLRRATNLERALGTRSRIYFKYEGGNLTGSHKLNTAVAQAYYYRKAGATRLAVATGAGQWGTAVAAACQMFGLECHVYMVRSSMTGKPYRRTMMELLGAQVTASPSDRTGVGRRFLAAGDHGGTLSVALAEAVEETRTPGTRFCAGSGETYSLLHQTVIGLEARAQLAERDVWPDVVVAGLGAGSNFGGLAFPFLGSALRGERAVRCLSVEPAACPKLTRGRYAYDYTDSSERTALQKMYTLGHRFTPPAMHAGGLRYHATAKVVSALYDRGLIEAAAYQQREIFSSATLFTRCEGIVPAPESAHAVHGAVVEAARADERGEPATILFALSGHGIFDMGAYRSYLDGEIADDIVPDAAIAASLAHLPTQPVSSDV
ncbi:TrpB-like pyridoxal phosphate-dependent enzyme [Micromonospora echinofusca]|uniref:tryptophan synthase n=1 Tax=Micromonospora echinofusca TaxID=47858 RepID=A0ABS3VJD7_MICEH|nr:TrpB-like pyridoxal phosphate-dependent enzyme [Micromonospora echinofusca]MBO4204629.1 TrpB-like pyridoxal phosphate-dependent enzyme [Micromonospora echinofusca]